MRLHDTLDDILGSKIKIRTLRLLYRSRGLFSGREISRLIGFSPTHTISNLRDLEAQGLITRQRAGNVDIYQLDEKNSAVEGVLGPIFNWENSLLDELAGLYVEKLGDSLASVRLFGSVARGEEKPGSDVDLLLTLADNSDPDRLEELIIEADLEAGRRVGCPVSSIYVTESEYAKRVKGKKGFWKDLPRESRLIFEREG